MKQFFYVSLDIDGVLWDEFFIKLLTDSGVREKGAGNIDLHLKPSSMAALNFLIDTLKENFEVVLVISSLKRFNMPKILNILKSNNLSSVSKIDNTLLSFDMKRGIEIKEYLCGKKDNKNFCIIDDEIKDIKPFFNKNKIIETSDQKALHISQVKQFLCNNNLLQSCEEEYSC